MEYQLIYLKKHKIFNKQTIIADNKPMSRNWNISNQIKSSKTNTDIKKGDETIFDNYRPISILLSISNVFERIILNQIHHYCHINDLYFTANMILEKNTTELETVLSLEPEGFREEIRYYDD